MSYDLHFRPRTGTIDADRCRDYFSGRTNDTVNLEQAWYQNEDTGVYFGFELNDPNDGTFDEESPFHPVSFNINFFRPTYFVLEAEPEVSAFVRAFDMVVLDPQMQGMGEGEYDRQRLVSGWNHGNEFGYKAMLRNPELIRLEFRSSCKISFRTTRARLELRHIAPRSHR